MLEMKVELKNFLSGSNMHEYALIRLMYTSGMTVEEICRLDFCDFLMSIAEYFYGSSTSPFDIKEIHTELRCRNDVFGMWELSHDNFPYITFCTPSSMYDLLDSLYFRKVGESIDLCDPLFVRPDGNRLTENDIETIFARLNTKNHTHIKPFHLRKLFIDILKSSVPKESPFQLLGYEFENVGYLNISEAVRIKSDYEKAAPKFNLGETTVKMPLWKYQNILEPIRKRS